MTIVEFNLTILAGKMSSRASRTLYVGNLPGDIREREVEDLFYKYGPIAHIDLKIPPRPPGYAFVEVSFGNALSTFFSFLRGFQLSFKKISQFEEARDAEDAIRGRDGYDFDGHRLRVELAHGGRGQSSSDRHSSYSGGGGGGGGGGRGRGGVSRRSEYRVVVTGLPSSASWQDLKDHMRRAGDVCFSQVFRDGSGTTGIIDYTNYEDMKYAVSYLPNFPLTIKKLDDSEFRNAFSRAYVRVREYDSKRDSSRSPSRGRSHSRGRSDSHGRSLSQSRSRSKSPKNKSTRRSPARSRSRSVSRSRSGSKARSLSSYKFTITNAMIIIPGVTWGLDIRILMGYGSVVEACCFSDGSFGNLHSVTALISRSRSRSPLPSFSLLVNNQSMVLDIEVKLCLLAMDTIIFLVNIDVLLHQKRTSKSPKKRSVSRSPRDSRSRSKSLSRSHSCEVVMMAYPWTTDSVKLKVLGLNF
ncbi:hypothetical protein DKX38_021283 [Salix brachista]|uniref:RRM domain-containing protein n=1 Tax=Salix brachista TaxID=2182728 RepID=A0A5N5K8X5_9ROSI|nr:hypothetical protein DKX38_021283 [Salix brachista]